VLTTAGGVEAGVRAGVLTIAGGVEVGVGAGVLVTFGRVEGGRVTVLAPGALAVGVLTVFAGGNVGVGVVLLCSCRGDSSGVAAGNEELGLTGVTDEAGFAVSSGSEPRNRITANIVNPTINAPPTIAATSSGNFRFGGGPDGAEDGPTAVDTTIDEPVQPIDGALVLKVSCNVSQNSWQFL
jgi:hypothetical protein